MRIELLGDKELIAKFQALKKSVGKAALRKGTRAGCKIVLAYAKAQVRVKTGATRANLKVRAMPRSRKWFGTRVSVGGTKAYAGKQFYYSFVELGHRIGKRQSKSDKAVNGTVERRSIPGTFKLMDAAKAAAPSALAEAIRVTAQEIDKAMRI